MCRAQATLFDLAEVGGHDGRTDHVLDAHPPVLRGQPYPDRGSHQAGRSGRGDDERRGRLARRRVEDALERARDNVRNGESLSAPFAQTKVFPPMVVKMMAIGERSGALDALLEKIAEFYDQQVEAEVKGLTSMIEPIMIAIMGVIVGGIVLAVFLPIFKLQEKLSGG